MSAIAQNWCFFTIFKQPFWSPSAYQATLMPGASDLAILMWSQWIKSHRPNNSCLIGPTLAQFLYAIWVYQTCMCCFINSLALLMLKWLRFSCIQWMTQPKEVVLQMQFYSVMWMISSTLNDKKKYIISLNSVLIPIPSQFHCLTEPYPS